MIGGRHGDGVNKVALVCGRIEVDLSCTSDRLLLECADYIAQVRLMML